MHCFTVLYSSAFLDHDLILTKTYQSTSIPHLETGLERTGHDVIMGPCLGQYAQVHVKYGQVHANWNNQQEAHSGQQMAHELHLEPRILTSISDVICLIIQHSSTAER